MFKTKHTEKTLCQKKIVENISLFIDIYFTAVGVINIPTSNEIIAAMEEIISNADQSA